MERDVKFQVDFPFTKAAETGTGELELKGYASTWTLDRDDEVVDPAAFHNLDAYLRANPILLWQHDQGKPIGRVKAARVDDSGLHVHAYVPPPDASEEGWAHTAYSKIKRGIVRTFSIGGNFHKRVERGGQKRIVGVDLYEISVVSVPANPDSIFEAAVKAYVGSRRPDLSPKAVSQMEQLIGLRETADPDLLDMSPDELADRYEELADLYVKAGHVPPGFSEWRELTSLMDAEDEPLGRLRYGPELMAVVQAAKGLKRGRVLSRVNEDDLRSAAETILRVLGRQGADADADEAPEDQGKALASGTPSAGGALVGKQADDEADDEDDGEEPPNLRGAEGDKRCGTCRHFDGGYCERYDYDVESNDLCDSWADGRGG